MKPISQLEGIGNLKESPPLGDFISPGEFRNLRFHSLTKRLGLSKFDYLSKLRLGKTQRFKNLEIIPIFMPGDHGIKCLTMNEALAERALTVTEIGKDELGRLRVANSGKKPILLLAGEELVGGQQNRTLNTTILLKGNSEAVIPVSCTERGRASSPHEGFVSPETIVPYQIRMKFSQSAVHSFTMLGAILASFAQIDIWSEIQNLIDRMEVNSRTSALADIYQSKADELNENVKAFKCMPNQNGLLAMINGEVVGLDVVPHRPAYKKLHYSLVKSYALSAILEGESEMDEVPSSDNRAWSFLQKFETCNEKRHEVRGYGKVCQFAGDAIVGSVLICDNEVVHMSLFNPKGR